MTAVTIPTAGHGFTVSWRSVSGATGVEVTAAELALRSAPAAAIRYIPSVAGAASDVDRVVVTIPGGERTVRSLTLHDLTRPGEDDPIEVRDERVLIVRREAAAQESLAGVGTAVDHD